MIKLSRSYIGIEETQAISDMIEKDGYLGMGQEVRSFEKELQEYLQTDHSLACVNTGTSALHLAVQACGIGPGDEVIIPSITYVASFQAVSATGAKAIACDVDESFCFMDVNDVKKKITPRTKALMPVHYAGQTFGLDKIYEVAKEKGLRVIEDAALSFGGFYQGRKIGATGDIVCFSFDSIKTLTCGEGGAVLSSDINLINNVKDLRLLGVEKDSDNRYLGKRSWDFDVKEQGWRYHLSNLYGVIGRTQLKKMPWMTKKRQELCSLYYKLLDPSLVHSIVTPDDQHVAQIYPILVKDPTKRDDLKEYLNQQKIETGLHYKPNHLLTKYRSEGCSVAEMLWSKILTLPLHCHLSEEQVIFICNHVNTFLEKN